MRKRRPRYAPGVPEFDRFLFNRGGSIESGRGTRGDPMNCRRSAILRAQAGVCAILIGCILAPRLRRRGGSSGTGPRQFRRGDAAGGRPYRGAGQFPQAEPDSCGAGCHGPVPARRGYRSGRDRSQPQSRFARIDARHGPHPAGPGALGRYRHRRPVADRHRDPDATAALATQRQAEAQIRQAKSALLKSQRDLARARELNERAEPLRSKTCNPRKTTRFRRRPTSIRRKPPRTATLSGSRYSVWNRGSYRP